MDIRFKNKAHEDFYYSCLQCFDQEDDYHRAIFFTLGVCDDTRRNVDSLFDFEKDIIKPEGMTGGWITSGSIQVVRMAFNLWNGYDHSIEGGGDYTPETLFACEFAPYFAEALKLRHPAYFRENQYQDIALAAPPPIAAATPPPSPEPPESEPAKPKLTFFGVLGESQTEEYNQMWQSYAEVGGAEALSVTQDAFIQYVLEELQAVGEKYGAEVQAFVYKGVYEEVMVPKEIHNSAVFIANGGSRARYGDMLRKGIFLNDFGDDYFKALAQQFPETQRGTKTKKSKAPRRGAR